MKALSIQQPWLYAILHLGKRIENRSRFTSFRGEFLLHASRTIDISSIGILTGWGYEIPKAQHLLVGGIIGKATLKDVIMFSGSKWFFGPFGWVLDNVQPVEFMPCPGARGHFFDVDYNPVTEKKIGQCGSCIVKDCKHPKIRSLHPDKGCPDWEGEGSAERQRKLFENSIKLKEI